MAERKRRLIEVELSFYMDHNCEKGCAHLKSCELPYPMADKLNQIKSNNKLTLVVTNW